MVDATLRLAARVSVRRPGRHVVTLRHNLALTTGRPVDDRLLRDAVASQLRNVYEMLALPGLPPFDLAHPLLRDNLLLAWLDHALGPLHLGDQRPLFQHCQLRLRLGAFFMKVM